jgi:hypothetical protein
MTDWLHAHWLGALAFVVVLLALGASIWAIIVENRAENRMDCLQRWAVVETNVDREQRVAILALARNRTLVITSPIPIREPDC